MEQGVYKIPRAQILSEVSFLEGPLLQEPRELEAVDPL
jgi:hypothetical protein